VWLNLRGCVADSGGNCCKQNEFKPGCGDENNDLPTAVLPVAAVTMPAIEAHSGFSYSH